MNHMQLQNHRYFRYFLLPAPAHRKFIQHLYRSSGNAAIQKLLGFDFNKYTHEEDISTI